MLLAICAAFLVPLLLCSRIAHEHSEEDHGGDLAEEESIVDAAHTSSRKGRAHVKIVEPSTAGPSSGGVELVGGPPVAASGKAAMA
jgi:hypothetical protein